MESPRDRVAAIRADSEGVADHGAGHTAGMGGGAAVGEGIGRGPVALPSSREAWARTFSSLRIPGYRFMYISMMASFMGMMMQQIARGWLTWELTGSAGSIGIVSSSFGLPMLLFSLFGGVVADRLEKRNVIVIAQGLTGVLAAVVAVLVLTGVIQVWHLVVMGLLQGTIFAFNMPSRQAILPELVGEKELMNAIALNSAGMNLTRILGPALAGGLVAVPFIDLEGVFFLIAFTYVISVITLFKVPVSDSWRGQTHRPMIKDLFSGFAYIRRSPTLLTLIGMGFVLILFGMPYQMLMPVFAGDVFNVGPAGFGVLQAAAGVGAIGGTLWVAANAASITSRGQTQLLAAFAFGVALFIFGFTSGLFGAFWLGLLILPFVGIGSQVFMALNNTMIMTNTPHEMRGRVMSVYMMTFSLMPVSILPMGFLSDSIGIATAVAGAAAIIVVYVALIWTFRPSYRQLA
ncbi:MAG: MFS transporter [Dehalococcoidia bacterium]